MPAATAAAVKQLPQALALPVCPNVLLLLPTGDLPAPQLTALQSPFPMVRVWGTVH